MGFESLARLPWEGIGIVGVVLILGAMVYNGFLVPKSIVADLTSSRDARIKDLAEERDKWEGVANKALEALQVRNEQQAELMELARTTDAFIRALPRAGGYRQ